MQHRFFSVAVALLLATAATPAFAQRGRGAAPAAPAPPTPRGADGRVIWGALPGHKGVWNAQGSTLWDLDKEDPNLGFTSFNTGKMKLSEVPLQPWARALVNERMIELNEPYTRCKPSGGARNLFTPYGTEFLDFPEQKRFVITNTGGPHTYRIIYYDGRPHPKDLEPTYLGHSIGHWDGDTIVFDTIGFNEQFWIDRQGTPHTDKLHLVERLTRTDFNTIKYEVTIEDPGAYTAPWKGGFNLRFTPDQESFEFMCQDNMRTSEINGLTSRVVP